MANTMNAAGIASAASMALKPAATHADEAAMLIANTGKVANATKAASTAAPAVVSKTVVPAVIAKAPTAAAAKLVTARNVAAATAVTTAVVHGDDIVESATKNIAKPAIVGGIEHVAKPVTSTISWLMTLVVIGGGVLVMTKFAASKRFLRQFSACTMQIAIWCKDNVQQRWEAHRATR